MENRAEINVLKSVIRQPFAWPGGYERALIMDDGGCICHKCAKSEYWNILHSTRGNYRDGWQVSGSFIIEESAEYDPIVCDHCNKTLNDWD